MAVKQKSEFVCSNCGYHTPKWLGKCPECDSWNTMTEEIIQKQTQTKSVVLISNDCVPVSVCELINENEHRYPSGINEFDRVLGGGIVKGSVVLVGGDPGIGKSTLLLQMAKTISKSITVLYVTGEESEKQIKIRANRLGVDKGNLLVIAHTDAEKITSCVERVKPDVVIIDSIQTMYMSDITSSAGSVSQVRECSAHFIRCAKQLDIPFFIVGHVNKDGAIAGPKILEHMVDAVVYFEGDSKYSYRILRAVKNRYGSTNEIGVFEMRDDGLFEIDNPSMIFLQGRPENVSGTCVTCVAEGTRPIMAEIQALACQSPFSAPRRTSAGIDYNRMALLIAVLEKRAGIYFSNYDAYINVVGGLKLDEPSSDLACVLALASALKDFVIPNDLIAVGEVGLGGEIRPINAIDMRISEAKRLGFTKIMIPYGSKLARQYDDIEILKIKSVKQAIYVLSNLNE